MAFPTQVYSHDLFEIHGGMGTRTGMIVLGTIVPIRHLTCYHLLQRNERGRFGRRFNERDKEDPAAQGRRSGLRPNRGNLLSVLMWV